MQESKVNFHCGKIGGVDDKSLISGPSCWRLDSIRGKKLFVRVIVTRRVGAGWLWEILIGDRVKGFPFMAVKVDNGEINALKQVAVVTSAYNFLPGFIFSLSCFSPASLYSLPYNYSTLHSQLAMKDTAMHDHAELPIHGRETKASPTIEEVLELIAAAEQEARDMRATLKLMEQDRQTRGTGYCSHGKIGEMKKRARKSRKGEGASVKLYAFSPLSIKHCKANQAYSRELDS